MKILTFIIILFAVGFIALTLYIVIGFAVMSDRFDKRSREPLPSLREQEARLQEWIAEVERETPPKPGPYSGPEWNSSAPSFSSPTETEAPSAVSASPCSAAASSSPQADASSPIRPASGSLPAHGGRGGFPPIPGM